MNGQFYTFEGWKYLLGNALTPTTLTEFTGTTTLNSATVSAVSSFTGLAVGQMIRGANIPAGTYITALNTGASTLTLSQVATGAGAAAVLVAGGLYTQSLPLTVHLLQGAIPQGDVVTFSQLTEANYDGYAPQGVIGTPLINTPFPRAYACAQYEMSQWIPTDYVVPNTITGHCITFTPPGASLPTVVALEVYSTAVPLTQDGDILSFNPTLSTAFDNTAGVASPGIP